MIIKDNVILIAGLKRSGKDTVADMLLNKINGSRKLAYAAPMKDIIADMLGITTEKLEVLKNDESNPHRGYLQRFGQKAKEYFGENCWGDYVEHIISNLPKGSTTIISDFRMPVEAIKGALTINVLRKGIADTDLHVSETALRDFVFDVTVYNDGTLQELDDQLSKLVSHLKAIGKI